MPKPIKPSPTLQVPEPDDGGLCSSPSKPVAESLPPKRIRVLGICDSSTNTLPWRSHTIRNISDILAASGAYNKRQQSAPLSPSRTGAQ